MRFRPPQIETVPARIFRFFMCLRQKTPLSLCLCHFQCQTLLFLFFSLPNLFRFICLLPSNVSFNTSNTIQIVFLAIVPGKLEMCLQENLVDCTDCGGLPARVLSWSELINFFQTLRQRTNSNLQPGLRSIRLAFENLGE